MSTVQAPTHRQAAALSLVACGGAVGAMARYLVSQAWGHHGVFDWSVLAINCLGAFILGALLEALSRGGPDEGARRRLRLFAGTGFCGAFTTYSTFAHDVVDVAHRSATSALAWGVAEVALGFLFALVGAAFGARWERGYSR